MLNGIMNLPGQAANTAGSVLSAGNQLASGTMWLAGASLSTIASAADVVLDGTAAYTGMQGGMLHKTGQIAISMLDAGASLTKAYDLVAGNTATAPNAVFGDATALTHIKAQVENIINGTSPDVTHAIQTLVAKIFSLASHVQAMTPMTEDQYIGAVFSGAHIVVADGGALFQDWTGAPGLNWQNRQSSHYQEPRQSTGIADGVLNAVADKFHPLAAHQQQGVDLPRGLGHLLIGRTPSASGGDTFFQLEAHGTSAREFFPHMMDFVLHKASGNAQGGPLGLIQMTEKPDSTGTTSNVLVVRP